MNKDLHCSQDSVKNWQAFKFPTTTEIGRNIHRLERLFDQACQDGIHDSRMIEVGPGAAAEFLASRLHRPSQEDSTFATASFQLFRNLDTLVRKIPNIPLRSFEPAEIVEVARSSADPNVISELIIVDRDTRVGKTALQAASALGGTFVQFDLEGEVPWTQPKSRLLCAYKSLERCKDPKKAFRSVSAMIMPGGLISTTYKIEDPSFQPLDLELGLFRKSA